MTVAGCTGCSNGSRSTPTRILICTITTLKSVDLNYHITVRISLLAKPTLCWIPSCSVLMRALPSALDQTTSGFGKPWAKHSSFTVSPIVTIWLSDMLVIVAGSVNDLRRLTQFFKNLRANTGNAWKAHWVNITQWGYTHLYIAIHRVQQNEA